MLPDFKKLTAVLPSISFYPTTLVPPQIGSHREAAHRHGERTNDGKDRVLRGLRGEPLLWTNSLRIRFSENKGARKEGRDESRAFFSIIPINHLPGRADSREG